MVVLALCEVGRQLIIRKTSFGVFQFINDSSLGQVISVQLLPNVSEQENVLTLNIPSLGRQRCLPSWGPRRTPWFFCNFSTV